MPGSQCYPTALAMNFIDLPGDVFAQLRALAVSSDRLTAARGQMLLHLLEHLQRQSPTPGAHAIYVIDELWISVVPGGKYVSIRIDWPDRGEVKDGLPAMHYRMQLDRGERELSLNVRAATIPDAEKSLREMLNH